MIDDVRALLATEFKRRLTVGFPATTIYEGAGGVWGDWSRAIPCLHVYELSAELKGSDTQQRGTYKTVLPIQVEFISRLQNKALLFTEGRGRLVKLQQAIELDRRFKQRYGLDTAGSDLVVSYHMVANEIVEVIPNVIDVAVVYEFTFIERFLGY